MALVLFPQPFLSIIQFKMLPLQPKTLFRSVAGATRHGRKVRAAQGAPLLKVEAIGDSRCRQKRMTALPPWSGAG